MASLTYACFIPAKGLIRGLSANSSNIAFEVPLASKYDGGNLALYHIRIHCTQLKTQNNFYCCLC